MVEPGSIYDRRYCPFIVAKKKSLIGNFFRRSVQGGNDPLSAIPLLKTSPNLYLLFIARARAAPAKVAKKAPTRKTTKKVVAKKVVKKAAPKKVAPKKVAAKKPTKKVQAKKGRK